MSIPPPRSPSTTSPITAHLTLLPLGFWMRWGFTRTSCRKLFKGQKLLCRGTQPAGGSFDLGLVQTCCDLGLVQTCLPSRSFV
ncbi:hypothetical protein ACFX14_013057 [Malus domestica]